jgi:tricarballylate dehydrogenase
LASALIDSAELTGRTRVAHKEKYDVVVVGGGSAAFEAAIAAQQAGSRRVIMLEKATESERGGNARFSHVGFRFVHSGGSELNEFMSGLDEATFRQMQLPAYTTDQFRADLQRVTQGRIDPVLADYMVGKSNAAVHWLKDIGIDWEHDTCTKIGDKLFFEPGIHIHPVGGGPGLLNRLEEIAKARGIVIRYETRVCAIHGNDRAVEGVHVSSPDGDYDVNARAIIVCSGGFQASAEMRARYLGPNADLAKVRGSKHNTGEVLQMLLSLGAKASGHWQGAHMSPIDGKAPSFETPVQADGRGNSMNRYDYPFGITVNALGLRFFDEGENKHAYTYAKTGHAVMGQPGGVAYQIYDQKGVRLFRHGRHYPTTMVEADTLEDLASKIGVAPEVLAHTVKEFNDACRKDVAFDATKLDGKSTVGIAPKKSNWAEPLTEPPFRALPVSGGITFTFGGVQVDTDARVLNSSNQPIRGLYASGDVMGLFFHNYPSCTGQTRNAVFSYAAGKNAAEMLG